MNKAGSIISIIGGLFAVIAGFLTLLASGVGNALHAEGSQTLGLLGWGGVFYSFFVIIFASMALGINSWLVSSLLILSSLFGIVLGGGFVAIFMGLSLVGGLISLIAKLRNAGSATPIKLNLGTKIALSFLVGVLTLFSASLIDQLIKSKASHDIVQTETAIVPSTEAINESNQNSAQNCEGFAKEAKATNLFINAIDKIREFDPKPYEATFGKDDIYKAFLPQFPGKLIVVCEGEFYFRDGTTKELLFTVSKQNDGNIFVATKDNSQNKILSTFSKAIDEVKVEKEKVSSEEAFSRLDKSNFSSPELSDSYTPSFDCANATTNVEKFICNDAELSKLDHDLSIKYDLLKSKLDPSLLKEQQQIWLKSRDICTDRICIRNAYRTRFVELVKQEDN